MLKRPARRPHADTQLLVHLESQHHDVAEAIGRAQGFGAIGRPRQANRFNAWLARTGASGVAPLQRFARGRRADCEAVTAGRGRPWSNGPGEGPSNRLQMRQRQMFGRATLALRSRRCLLAA